ncbi:hypothetical protein SADUNF_Sadunf01G0166600 [Salix dunnii]|uniref:Endoplasmic reticulum vesicle transporter protein n=1 Tax=Salix dunnii TaxID=1413687 RepID=A0A835NC71_9ROSI|nr:hypothetical protein SADUNF_Sadunf01G0166600 [Salix dunnii]
MEGVYQKLRNLDAYPKINEDFYSRTLSGGLITLISSTLMLFLFFSEFSLYLHAVTETKLLVDTSRGQTLRINFDIDFPAIRCSLLSVDAIDISGEQHHDIRHDITKKRINAHGDVIEVRKDGIGGPKIDRPLQKHGGRLEHNEEYCGSCFGAEMGNQVEGYYKGGDDPTFAWVVWLVKGVADGIKGKHSKGLGKAALLASSDWVCLVDHWVRLDLHFTLLKGVEFMSVNGLQWLVASQCQGKNLNKHSLQSVAVGIHIAPYEAISQRTMLWSDDHCCNSCEEVREAYRKKGWAMTNMDLIDQCKREGFVQMIKDEKGEGCNINGSLEVNRVAGNFHFVPVKSFHHSIIQLQDLLDLQTESYNISHRINRLAFGDYFPGVVNPLDGTQLMHETPNGVQQFFIKVVPTIYTDIRGRTVHSNQYSVTEHFKKSESIRLDSLPGVYFIYDFSPIKVTFKEEHTSFLHFMTSICAIIGGSFSVFYSPQPLALERHLHYRRNNRFLYLSWSKSNQEESGNWQIRLTISVAFCDIFRVNSLFCEPPGVLGCKCHSMHATPRRMLKSKKHSAPA